MKIRINGNSLRLRLKQTDVADLAEHGIVSERISFGKNHLDYILKTGAVDELHAVYNADQILVVIPEKFADEWPVNDVVGIDTKQNLGDNEFLKILVEKDFVCLDDTEEDQSDNYQNPNSTC